jgi:hypothetical protein
MLESSLQEEEEEEEVVVVGVGVEVVVQEEAMATRSDNCRDCCWE